MANTAFNGASTAWPAGDMAFSTTGPAAVIPQLAQVRQLQALAQRNPALLRALPNVPVDMLPRAAPPATK